MPAEPDEADTDFGLGPFQRRHIAVGCCTWALSGMHIGLFVVSGEHEPCEQKPRGVHPFFGYRTVTDEFRLVCEDEYKIPMLGSVYMGGFLVGALAAGKLSDGVGRRRTQVGGAVWAVFSALGFTLARDFWVHVAMRIALGITFGGVFTLPNFILCQELIGAQHRTYFTLAMNAAFDSFLCLPILVFEFVQSWRALAVINLVAVSLVATLCVLLEESPVWLAGQGRIADAQGILDRMARENGEKAMDASFLAPPGSTAA